MAREELGLHALPNPQIRITSCAESADQNGIEECEISKGTAKHGMLVCVDGSRAPEAATDFAEYLAGCVRQAIIPVRQAFPLATPRI
jgi:hypothetical protein